MITLSQLRDYVDKILLTSLFSDYCVNGLQVQGKKEITRLATAVSASLETIQAAIAFGANALIVHHGLFWTGDSPVIEGTKREKIQLLLQNNVSLLAYHLPLDANTQFGNNWKAAKDLGWNNLQPFGMHRNQQIGVRGEFSSMPQAAFQKQLEQYYHHAATCVWGGKKEISSAALISGGSYKSIPEAASAGVDCFITGNFDEPAWYQALEEKINFLALGHSATERIGPKALGEHLKEQFNLEYQFIDIHNPF